MMKKIFSIYVFMILLLAAVVVAQKEELPDAGITPDSFLWGLDKALDRLTLLLTFDKGEKAKKGLEIARERLLEVKSMVEENKLDAAEKAQEEHGKTLMKVKQSVKEIEDDDSLEEIKEVIEIEKELEEHDEKVEQTFGELKVKIEVKGELTQQQKTLVDSILNSLKGQTGEVEIEIENKKDKIKIKIKQETGKSGEEVEKEIKEDIGLSNFEKKRAEKMKLKAENKWNDVIEKAQKYKVDIPDKTEFSGLLESGDALLEEGKNEEAKDVYEAAKDLAEALKKEIEETGEAVGEREIEVEIKEGKAKVDIEIGEAEWEFELDIVDLDAIINEISTRTGLGVEEINAIIEVEVEEKEIEIEAEEEEAEEEELEEEIEIEAEVEVEEEEFEVEELEEEEEEKAKEEKEGKEADEEKEEKED